MALGTSAPAARKQLETWSAEQHSFKQAAAAADQKRVQTEQRVEQQRKLIQQLSSQLRVMQDAVGSAEQEKHMLLNQKERLQQQLQQERHVLEESSNESKRLQEGEKQRKQAYITDMDQWNQQLSDMLMHQEEARLQSLVTLDSATQLRERYQQSSSPETNIQAATSNFESAVQSLEETTHKYRKSVQEKTSWQQTIEALRQDVMKEKPVRCYLLSSGMVCSRILFSHSLVFHEQDVSETELLNIEHAWAESKTSMSRDESNGDPLALFYAESSQPEQDGMVAPSQ
jgi:chromosome segregation ATPase